MPDARKRPRLTDAQRRVLAEILEAGPRLSAGQVAAIFEARAGRPVDRRTVQQRRARGPYPDRPGNRRLADGLRAALVALIVEDGGESNSGEIARQFEALTGRRVTPNTVLHHRDLAGLPRAGKGKGGRSRNPYMEARAGAEAAEKRRRDRDRDPKVDRSPRPGRTARLHVDGKGADRA